MTDDHNKFINPILDSIQAVFNKENTNTEEITRIIELTSQMNILSARFDALDTRRNKLELINNDIKERSIALEDRTDERKHADGWVISDEIHKYFKERDELLADCKKLDADRDTLITSIKSFTENMI